MTIATDVEIYIARLEAADLQAWLETRLDAVVPQRKRKGMPKNAVPFEGEWQGERFTIIVMEKVMDGFTSVWLNSPNLPWQDDAECAREAVAHFKREARIAAGGWQEKDDPDAWIQFTPEGEERPIQWRTE